MRFLRNAPRMAYTMTSQKLVRKEAVMTDVKGNLHVSNEVIAEIVGSSVIECYGVTGMSDPATSAPSIKMLTATRARKGVAVENGATGIAVTVYVVLQYGVNISVVTQNIKDQVSFALSTYVQVPVESIDVHVTGIKVRR